MIGKAVPLAVLAALSGEAMAQSFQIEHTEGPQFFYSRAAEKITFSYLPPATKMFASADGTPALFPPLFPHAVHFQVLNEAPAFVAEHFRGSFTAYALDAFVLALAEDYTLFSASLVNGQLVLLARDRDGDFVTLQPDHFAVFTQGGSPLTADEITSDARNIAVLVDRSGSLLGFDASILGALQEIAATPIASDFCGITEFGLGVQRIVPQKTTSCADAFAAYSPSPADGSTPLFAAMESAYREAGGWRGISAQIIISDGLPTDQPSADLAALARQIPTFVLWVGDHSEDYLAGYSSAHAISQSGDGAEITDFLRGVSFSVRAHQTFALRLGDGS